MNVFKTCIPMKNFFFMGCTLEQVLSHADKLSCKIMKKYFLLAVSATTHFIWLELNSRIFQFKATPTNIIISKIYFVVKQKVSNEKFVKPCQIAFV